ncbi:MAG: BBP7 family outer membrane beta-barrel protein [Planctomycetes bacterium]|nr:BBP7 family outer membrane beta-barrel protein [Planctomycetota bacterium]
MRVALLTCSLCVITAALASAQSPPATLPTTTPPAMPPALAGASAVPVAPPPTLSEATLTDLTSDGVSSTGRPFSMSCPRMWANADYLLFWYTPMNTPTLIRTIPAVQANDPNATGTSMFPTKSQVHYDNVSGVRLNVGYNFDTIGFDASGFILQRKSLSTSQFSDGSFLAIAQPYIPAGTGTTTDLLSSRPNPGGYSGGVNAAISSQIFGFEANVRRAWFTFMSDSTNIIGGFRYFDLQENLSITSVSRFPSGALQSNSDAIQTHNSFYGGQIGFSTVYGGTEPGIGFTFTTKSGIGDVHQRVDLVGSNAVAVGGVPSVEAGGLYVRGLNAGSFSRDKFGFMQDIDLKLTYNFTKAFQVSFGYSMFYLSSVARPGNQLDPVVNDQNIRFVAVQTPSNSPQPVFAWHTHSFVLQGLTFGARLAY